jgi:hypothetical protein
VKNGFISRNTEGQAKFAKATVDRPEVKGLAFLEAGSGV